MARKFSDVLKKLKEVTPEDIYSDLLKEMEYTAPEVAFLKLSNYINRAVVPSSTNNTSIAIYAVLCDCTEAEMKSRFEADEL